MLKNLISGAISSGLISESNRQKATLLLNKDIHEWGLSDIAALDLMLPEKTKLENLYYGKIKQYIKKNIRQKEKSNVTPVQEVTPATEPVLVIKKDIFKSVRSENQNLYIELKLSIYYSLISEAAQKSNIKTRLEEGNKIVLENINQEKYDNFVKYLESKNLNTEELKKHKFITSEKVIERKTRGEIDIKRCDPSINPNWDFEIRIINVDDLEIPTKDYIRKSIMSSFAGEPTFDKNTDRSLYMVNRCPIRVGDVEERDAEGNEKTSQVLKNGYYIRGTPSMYSKFLSISRRLLTNTSYGKLDSEIKKYATDGLFYDGRLGKRIDPSNVRFDGALDITPKIFESQIKALSKAYFEGELRHKGVDPKTSPEKFKQIGLYAEQVDGIRFLYTRSNALLADETGLGKTVQLLAAGELRRRVDSGEVETKTISPKKVKRETSSEQVFQRKSGIIITKNAVVGDAIRGLRNMTSKQIDPNSIWSGDQLFSWIASNGYDKIDYTKDQETKAIPDKPPFTWCVLNYEKFSIAPVNSALAIQRIENALNNNSQYLDIILNEIKRIPYSPESIEDNFNQIAEKHKQVSPSSERYLRMMLGYFKDKNGNFVKQKITKTKGISSSNIQQIIKKIEYHITGIKRKHAENARIKINRIKARESAGQLQKEVTKKINELNEKIAIIDSRIDELKLVVDRAETLGQKQQALLDYEKDMIDQELLMNELHEAKNEWQELEDLRIKFQDGGKRKILTRYLELMAKRGNLSLVILDEVHSVKNGDPNSRDIEDSLDHEENFTTFNIQEVTENVQNVWGASATTVANRVIDLHNQLRAINSPLGYLNYHTFQDSVSVALPGMDGEEGTAQAIRDNLVAEGVILQRSKSQIWNKDKANLLSKIIKDRTGLDIKFNTSLAIVELLQKYIKFNESENSLMYSESKKQILNKIKELLKYDKFNEEQVSYIVSSIAEVDKNGDLKATADGTLVSKHGSFKPWHPRQFISTAPTDYAIKATYEEDFERRVEESLMRNPDLMVSRNFGGVLFVHYKHAAAKAKVPYTLKRISPYLMQCKRVGVFTASTYARHLLIEGIKDMLSKLPESCELSGKDVLSIEGGQDLEMRGEEVADFKRSPEKSKYAAIVIQMSAGGTGISLENTAVWSIFNDLPISPAEDEQALGRFYRINSLEDVMTEYVVSREIERDEKYWESLLERKKTAQEITKLQERQLELLAMGADFNNDLYKEIAKKLGLLHRKRRDQELEAQKNTASHIAELKEKAISKIRKKSNSSSWYKSAKASFYLPNSNFNVYDDKILEEYFIKP